MAETFTTESRKDFFQDRDDRGLVVRGRIRPGATLRDARNEVALLGRGFQRDYPDLYRDRGATVRTMFEMRTQGSDINWKFSVIFTVLALVVLLVACTNAAGLLLSRARTRTREIAVRLAIGAGRLRLIRLLLTESLVLALIGGIGGIAVGYAGIAALQTFSIPAELPVKIPFQLDGRVLLACLGFSVLSAFFCGLAPALQSTRLDLVKGLKSTDGDDDGRTRRRLWGRNGLVVAQIAMSLGLLAASFLMFRGFHRLMKEGTGFTAASGDHLLMARFDPRLLQYDAPRTQQFYELLSERMRQEFGVRSAALTTNPPLGLEGFGRVAFVPEGHVMPRDRESFGSLMDSVDEGYFDTMGVSILQGRGFQKSDTADSPRVAIINEHLAKHYWPNGDALGKRMRLENAGGPPVEIVGIAQTIKYGEGFAGAIDFVYLPLSQHPVARLALMVRTDGDPRPLVQTVKDVVRRIDPNMPLVQTMTYGEIYRYSTIYGPGVAIKLVGTLGAVALVLAVAGLYGLIAYNVSRRTREIGIRVAIGARRIDVIRLVMGKGLALVATGTAIGLALGLAIERLMKSMIFTNAAGIDLTVYLVVVPTMILVTMLAAWIPARRACRIEPTRALRYE
jgi:predicted permease